MKESMKKDTNKAKGFYYLQINRNTKDSLLIIKYKDMEFISGQMEEFTKGNGKKIKCMAWAK